MDKKLFLLLGSDQKTTTYLQNLAKSGCAAVIIINIISIIATFFGIQLTTSLFPNVAGISPVVAVGFITAASSLLLQFNANENEITVKTIIALLLNCITFLVGSMTTIDYLLRNIIGYDPLFMAKLINNSISVDITVSFIFIGTALFLLPVPTGKHFTRIAQLLSLLSALISMFLILGYVYRSLSVNKIFPLTPMPLSSAVALAILSVSLLLSRPTRGFVKVLTRNAASSIFAFRLILLTLTVPAILGFLVLQGEQLSLYDAQTGLTLVVIGSICILSVSIWLNSSNLQKLELENLLIKNELENRNVTLEIDEKSQAAKILELEEEKQEAYEKLSYREKLMDLRENAL